MARLNEVLDRCVDEGRSHRWNQAIPSGSANLQAVNRTCQMLRFNTFDILPRQVSEHLKNEREHEHIPQFFCRGDANWRVCKIAQPTGLTTKVHVQINPPSEDLEWWGPLFALWVLMWNQQDENAQIIWKGYPKSMQIGPRGKQIDIPYIGIFVNVHPLGRTHPPGHIDDNRRRMYTHIYIYMCVLLGFWT